MFTDHERLLSIPKGQAEYSDRVAWVMAECSRLAYLRFEEGGNSEQKLGEHLDKGRFELIETFNHKAIQAYLARTDSFAVLAFRGTENDYGDIFTDLNARFYRDQTGAVLHRGFSRTYKLVDERVSKVVKNLGIPLYITGHSLGGALAIVAMLTITPSDKIAACYTFGSPRIDNAEFEPMLYKVPTYRVVHAADLVARLPFSRMGYLHTGDLRYITRTGTVLRNPLQVRLLFEFIYSVVRNWRTVFFDHRIAIYCEKLANWAEKGGD